MERLEWSAEFELGIDVIDAQHRRIVDYINELCEVEDSAGDREVVSRVLHNLVDYTVSHFAFEEALLEEVDYATLAPHQRTHQSFIRRIDDLKSRFEQGEWVVAELGGLLQTWLIDHIQSEDARYAPEVRKRFLSRDSVDQRSWVERAAARFFGR
ncbi:MAG: bacteriohemerythrin [Xanthomonadales bacterium]|nr:bacteriohemerythrin [Xanthomonadales bacterium]